MLKPIGTLTALMIMTASIGSLRAQTSPTDKAVAEALFQEGQKLLLQGATDTACAKLAESQRIDPRLGTLLNLATCHEQQGKLASAWAEFTDAASQATQARRPDRVKFAREHADALEKRLSHLTLSVGSAPEDLEVKIDGKVLGSGALASAIPVDPGPHEISARAPSKKPWSVSVSIDPSSDRTLEIPKLEDEVAPPAAPPSAAARPSPETARTTAPPVHDEGPSSQRSVGFALGALGIAGVGVGAVTGVLTFVGEGKAREKCPDVRCPDQESFDRHESAKTTATISTIAFAAGLAALGAGVVLILTTPRVHRASPGRALLTSPNRPGVGATW